MDRAMEDVCEERGFEDSSEFDLDYEFDAPKFFDFTSQESPSLAEEAERWFLFAESYAHSRLIAKLKWKLDEFLYSETSSNKSTDCQSEDSYNNDTDVSMYSEDTSQSQSHGSHKSKPKSQLRPCLPKSSTLFKPTASHLAKLNQPRFPSAKSTGRFQNPESPLNHSGDVVATKRQKLEIGYLKKVAHLRHQSCLSHKSSKKVISSSSGSKPSKLKVTIPKGPHLETNQRALRYRSLKAARPGDTTKSKRYTFKARHLNRKILEGPLLPQPKKRTACLPEFHEVNLRTSERAMNKLSDNDGHSIKRSPQRPKSLSCGNSSKGVVYRFKSQPVSRKILSSKGDIGVLRSIKRGTIVQKEFKLSGEKRSSQNPPTELFSKLSLSSNNQLERETGYQPPKDSKENVPPSSPPNGIVSSNKSSRCNFKQSQCGGVTAITDFRNRPTLTRSMKIH